MYSLENIEGNFKIQTIIITQTWGKGEITKAKPGFIIRAIRARICMSRSFLKGLSTGHPRVNRVNRQDKFILVALAIVAIIVFMALSCTALILIRPQSSRPAAAQLSSPQMAKPVAIEPSAVPPVLTPTSPPTIPTATVSPLPSPTSTRVVNETPLPTPKPTPINCLDHINDFEASGLMTNAQVEAYLRATIPQAHLDNCRAIRYIPKTVEVGSEVAAGKFIPLFRYISVYAAPPPYHTLDDLLQTLVHEIGHNAHFNLRLVDQERAKRWTELYQQSQATFAATGLGFVSEYARLNEFEDFAESYAAYVRQPGLLKHYNPDKYEYMRQNIFGGREYSP
jgi:hypothetical protein